MIRFINQLLAKLGFRPYEVTPVKVKSLPKNDWLDGMYEYLDVDNKKAA